ncbi:MAG: hypothetical protein KDA81_16765 [Planctomycetaceae bacterium]|nr:hypothetical protein [Planctomycetaceae bacterium]
MMQCVGWWQQSGLGRQPMNELVMRISDAQIEGDGVDVVAPFTLRGEVRADGSVEMVKQYLHRHSVLYVGNYDGEGTFSGQWDIDGYRGEWAIRLLRTMHPTDAIEEIEPF